MGKKLSKIKEIQKKLDEGEILDNDEVEHLHSEKDDVEKKGEDAYLKWIKEREGK